MKDAQTPRNKDIAHAHRRPKDSPSSKSISDHSKKFQKVSKKSLNSEFASVSEESLNNSVADSPNFSEIPLVLNNNFISDSSDCLESSLTSENQSTVTSDETSRVLDVAPISMIKSIEDETIDLSVNSSKEIRSNSSVEVDVVLNLLKQARIQVSSSSDVLASSKKCLDALIESYMRDLCALPDEEDEYISKRLRVVVICFMFWLVTVTAIMFRCSGTPSSFYFNAPPT